jgi:hypothetical protein
MTKKRQITVLEEKPDWDTAATRAASVKFDLYVKSREIQQISDSLQRILMLPVEQRQEWLQEHESIIAELMDSFMDDSVLALDGLQLDKESMELSVELVTQMRDAVNMIHRIFSNDDSLVS